MTQNSNDVERLEILKGPQGVYGTNALGGIVTVVSKKQRRANGKIKYRSKTLV